MMRGVSCILLRANRYCRAAAAARKRAQLSASRGNDSRGRQGDRGKPEPRELPRDVICCNLLYSLEKIDAKITDDALARRV